MPFDPFLLSQMLIDTKPVVNLSPRYCKKCDQHKIGTHFSTVEGKICIECKSAKRAGKPAKKKRQQQMVKRYPSLASSAWREAWPNVGL